MMFFTTNWASTVLNQAAGELLQNSGNFTEEMLLWEAAAAAFCLGIEMLHVPGMSKEKIRETNHVSVTSVHNGAQ
jgi:hypothetical protein